MNILISHVYSSDNKGDAAILSAQISELRRVLPQAQLHVLTLDHVTRGQHFEGVPMSNSLMHHVYYSSLPPAVKLLHALAMSLYTLVWAACYRSSGVRLPAPARWRAALNLLLQADVQIGVGGGYLRGKRDLPSTLTLWLLGHQIILAHLLGKPVVLYAQSIGPFFGWAQHALIRAVLGRVSLLLVREQTSAELLRRLHVPRRVHRVADTAFLFQGDTHFDLRQYEGLRHAPVTVGITVRQWLHPAAQRRYEQAMAELIEHVAAQGWGVAIIPQVTAEQHNDDDREVGRRIMALLPPHPQVVNIEDNLSHTQVKALYSGLDYLVGTRFHSVIFALSEYVPCLAVEYEHKTSGILSELQLERWCLPIDTLQGSPLIRLFDELVCNAPAIREHLARVIPPYKAQAALGADLISACLQAEQPCAKATSVRPPAPST